MGHATAAVCGVASYKVVVNVTVASIQPAAFASRRGSGNRIRSDGVVMDRCQGSVALDSCAGIRGTVRDGKSGKNRTLGLRPGKCDH